MDEINRGQKREVKLGPSDEFRANVRSLETIEGSLKTEKEESELSARGKSERAGTVTAKIQSTTAGPPESGDQAGDAQPA